MLSMVTQTKIHLLPDIVANKIAAGEVIQRPASVVKELLENALDAGSKQIHLVVKDGGKTLIQLIDDGAGMNEVDARMCLERHATSKITEAKDLFAIDTYGFRGAALSSIAAIAEVEITTRPAGQELGTRLVVENARIKKQQPVATAQGTQIAVRHLFGSVPVRRNFLKSNAVEMKHIIDEFQRAALARPDVAFSLHQNDTEIYQLAPAKLSHRIVHLFNKSYQKKLIPCEEKTHTYQLNGYIGPPSEAKKTRGGQFFFVNQRYIKSPYLHHAVKRAFEGLLLPDTHPFYVLCITMPPDQVDINIHPTKTEVKFRQEKLLYALVASTIKKALATHHFMHTIDFTQTGTQAIFRSGRSLAVRQPPPLSKEAKATSKEKASLFPCLTEPITREVHREPPDVSTKIQLHKKYILAQVRSGLLIVDQRAAHERILYERNVRALQKGEHASQKVLFPPAITLQPADFALLQSCKKELYRLGFRFEIEPFNKILITGQPVDALKQHLPIEELFTSLLEDYKLNAKDITLPTGENWARSFAKRANFPREKVLVAREMDEIVDGLFACGQPNHTPDGRPIWYIVPLEQFEEFLTRFTA